jgi:hypothetical protein
MPKGILMVLSEPSDPSREDEFNDWYDNVHLGEILQLDGYVAARRLKEIPGTDYQLELPHVAIYEMEADDLKAAFDGLWAAFERGDLVISDAIKLDPMPRLYLLEERGSLDAG